MGSETLNLMKTFDRMTLHYMYPENSKLGKAIKNVQDGLDALMKEIRKYKCEGTENENDNN